MPTAQQILRGLEEIANGWVPLAVLWHGYFGVAAFGLALGVRPSRSTAGILLALPLLSVSALAWASGNPFNGTFFGATGIVLLAIAVRLARAPVRIGPAWAVILGGLLFAFGWIYPHFLDAPSPLAYLYAAPTGLIPCPTLSIVIGLSLVLGGLGSRSWCLVLGALGTFYGVFGAVVLGVLIDLVLLAGAFAIVFIAFSNALTISRNAAHR